jgi:hypothetical protein
MTSRRQIAPDERTKFKKWMRIALAIANGDPQRADDILQNAWVIALERGDTEPAFGPADRKRLLGEETWIEELVSDERQRRSGKHLVYAPIDKLGIIDPPDHTYPTTLDAAEDHNQVYPSPEVRFEAKCIREGAPAGILDLVNLAWDDCETAAVQHSITMQAVDEVLTGLRNLRDGREEGDLIPIDAYDQVNVILGRADAADHKDGFTRETGVYGVRVLSINIVNGEVACVALESSGLMGFPKRLDATELPAWIRQHYHATESNSAELHVIADVPAKIRKPIRRALDDCWSATCRVSAKGSDIPKKHLPGQATKWTFKNQISASYTRADYIAARGVDPGEGFFGIVPILAAHNYLLGLVRDALNKNALRRRTRLEMTCN